MGKKKNTDSIRSHRESHQQIVERLAVLETERRENLPSRVKKLEEWAIGFSAKLETWIKAGAILLIILMSAQTPIVKEILTVILK